MYSNNNMRIIMELAKKHIFSNRLKFVISIIAIVLTTILLTTFVTITINVLNIIEYSSARAFGTNAHCIMAVKEEQIQNIEKNKKLKEYGKKILLGKVDSISNINELEKNILIYNMDEKLAEYNFISEFLVGKLPENINDIVIDDTTLKLFKNRIHIGDKINIEFKVDDRVFRNEFVLVGYYKQSKVMNYSKTLISNKYLKKFKFNENKDIELELMFKNKWNMERKVKNLIRDSNLGEKYNNYTINPAYEEFFKFEIKELVSPLIIILIIMLSGYLVIYNIFFISIIKDTRFYGLLKTIGVTKKQIKKIVIYESIILSFIGIPIGVLAGFFMGLYLYKYIHNSMSGVEFGITYNPFIIIISVIFSLVTVFISCFKPAKLATKISPIQAIRFGGNVILKNKRSLLANKSRIWSIALANVLQNKRMVFLVVVSLSLSIMLVNLVYTLSSNFTFESYFSGNMATDYTIGDAMYYNSMFSDKNKNVLTENLCNEIENMKGVNDFSKIYSTFGYSNVNKDIQDKIYNSYKKGLENGTIKGTMVDKNQFKTINLNIFGIEKNIYKYLDRKEQFNLNNQLKNGQYVIIAENIYNTGFYKKGDKININFNDNNEKTYEVYAVIKNVPIYLTSRFSFGPGGIFVYLPYEEFKKHVKDPSIMTALFNVEKSEVMQFDEYLKEKSKSNKTFEYRSRSIYKEEFDGMIKTLQLVGYSFSIIIGLIGILNLINLICTKIISRSHELAIMQSIGMTQKQLKRMLSIEGIYHSFLTMVFILTIGIPTMYYSMLIFSFSEKYISIVPMIIMIMLLCLFSWYLPKVIYKVVNGKSLVERIKIYE